MTWLLVGLGNPGPTYASTRHNVGWMTADELVRRAGTSYARLSGVRGELAQTRIGTAGLGVPGEGEAVLILKPHTFMNESGQAVRRVVDFHKVSPDQVIVVHDELDLEPGQLRVKCGGGDNGHRGLRSIRAHLGTGDFHRVRIGIGRPPGDRDAADYVLATLSARQREELAVDVARAADAAEFLMLNGLAETQNRFNN